QKRMALAADVDLAKVALAYAKQFMKPANVPMRVTFRGDLTELQNLDIADLKTILGSMELTGHGKVYGATTAQPQINLHLESNSFAVSELAQMAPGSFPKDISIKGKAQLAADIAGTTASSHIAAKLEGKDLDLAMADKFNKPAGMPMHLAVVGEVVRPV